MNLFEVFEPERMVKKIPCIRSAGITPSIADTRLIKRKLLESEHNQNIIRLARGEGRKWILSDIVGNDEVLFDWGMKGAHAFLEDSPFRRLLDPYAVDKATLKELVAIYDSDLDRRYENTFRLRSEAFRNSQISSQRITQLIDATDSSRDLQRIKDWLCWVLHTAGNAGFSKVSPWVSTTYGPERYKTAYMFGGRYWKGALGTHKAINEKFVIFDYWVPKSEEGETFETTRNIRSHLKSYGLPWYQDKHNEIMVKYALYPHQLIGYYYFEHDQLLYYNVNHHYLREWETNTDFAIGDYLPIDQQEVKFPANNPYRTIYSRVGRKFSTFEHR